MRNKCVFIVLILLFFSLTNYTNDTDDIKNKVNLAIKYYKNNKTNKAIELLEELLKINKNDSQTKLVEEKLSFLYYYKAQHLSKNKEYSDAIPFFKKSYKLIKKYDKNRADFIYMTIGRNYLKNNQSDIALKYLNKSLELVKKNNNNSNYMLVYQLLGDLYNKQLKYKKSILYFKKALEFACLMKDINQEGFFLEQLAHIFMKVHKFKNALKYYNKALKINNKTKEKGVKFLLLYSIGKAHNALGERYKAIISYKKAIPFAQKSGGEKKEASLYSNIGLNYLIQKNYSNAIEYYQKYLKTSVQLNDKRSQSYALHNIGICYHFLNNLNEAIIYLKKSLILSKKINYKIGIIDSQIWLGQIYTLQQKKKQSIKILLNAINNSRKFNDITNEANALLYLALAYQKFFDSGNAIKYLKLSLKLSRNTKNRLLESFILKSLGNIHSKRMSNSKKAIFYYQKFLKFAKSHKNNGDIYDAYNELGSVFMEYEDCSNALIYYRKALLVVEEKFGDKSERLREILTNIGACYINMHKNKEAKLYLDRALKLFNKLKISNMTLVNLLANYGSLYLNMKKIDKSNKFYSQALILNKKFDGNNILASIYDGLGEIERYKFRYSKAEKYFKLSLETSIRNNGYFNINYAKSLHNLGIIALYYNEYKNAIRFLNKSMFLQKNILGEGNIGYAQCLKLLGSTYMEIGDYKKSINYLKKSLNIMEKNNKNEHPEMIGIYWVLGKSNYIIGDLDIALTYYKKTLFLLKKKFSKNIPFNFGIYSDIGMIYSLKSDKKNAVIFFSKYFSYLKNKSISEKAVFDYKYNYGLGTLNYKLKRYEKAIIFFKNIVNLKKNTIIYPEVYIFLAKCYLSLGKKNEGINEFEKAFLLKNKTRYFLNDQQKEMFFSRYYSEYKTLFSLNIENESEEKALIVAEMSKSVVFTDLISKKKARRKKIFHNNPLFLSLIQKEDQILYKLKGKEKTIDANFMKTKIPLNIVRKISFSQDKLIKELANIRSEIKQKFPKYYEYLYPSPIKLADIQKRLKKDETYLSYYILKDSAYVFIITNKDFISRKLQITRLELTERIKSLRQSIITSKEIIALLASNSRSMFYEYYSKYILTYPKDSLAFYNRIFKPIEPLIKTKKIIISADEMLYGFPFEALIRDYKKSIDFDKKYLSTLFKKKKPLFNEFKEMKFLNDDYSIKYIPNAYALNFDNDKNVKSTKTTKGAIVFADPVFKDSNNWMSNNEDSKDEEHYEGSLYLKTKAIQTWPPLRLPETTEEAEGFVKEIGYGKIYKRQFATEENVFELDLSKAKYLLFSTHGVLGKEANNRDITEPALILSLVYNTEEYDGIFGMSEASSLRLNSDLVILSACNSAGENGKGGEGFAGMARSFLFAGSKAVIATHWQIESSSTKDFIVLLAKELKKNEGYKALKNVKSKIRDRIKKFGDIDVSLAHPYFWSSFVYLGN